MTQTLLQYWYLIRGHRPIGFWLLLWPVLWALWIAGQGHPNPEVFCVFVAGTWLMRSAGCAINDYADRGFDGHVQRTKDRPLAAGRISGTEALFVFAGLALVALALVLRLNPLVQLYSVGGAVLAVVYPFLKRYISLPQFWMGAAFSWGIPMAFAAQTGAVPKLAWLLFCGGLLWAAAYDTLYGVPVGEPIAIDWNTVVFNMLTIKGIYGREMYETWYKMIAFIQGGLDITPIITHRLKIDDFQAGFDAMRSGNSR